MNDDGVLGKAVGQLGDIAKEIGKQIVKTPVEIVEDIGKLVGEDTSASNAQENKQVESKGINSDKQRKEFIKGLYGKSDNAEKAPEKGVLDKKTIKDDEFRKQIKDKTQEEQKKLMELRQQLHGQYYQNLVNPPKQQEERPAQKIEREKKEEMQDLQQKEAKKPPPLATQRARERVEKFPGASG